MESLKMDKKNLMAPYQQSFRIDDLLTRKASEQQPPHFCPPLLTTNTTTSSSTSNNNNNSNDSLQPSPLTTSLQPPPLSNLLPPPLGQMGAQVKIENSMSYHPKGFDGQTCDSHCDEDSKSVVKRSYSSTSNEDDDDIYRKRKKARTAFSREQVTDLEKKFQEKKYLSSAERGELAEKLKLSDMQVKTWFQNRRMKYKRQSEEAEMEMKSPKYPYSSFVSYGGMSPFYGYVPMPYKACDTMSGNIPYTYSSSLRSPQQTTSPITAAGGMDVNFVMNSPTMLGSLPSPLSAGMSPRHHSLHAPLPRPPNGTSSYFNGLLTPISPSNGYSPHGYFTNEGVGGTGSISSHTQIQGFSEWPRTVPAPTTP